MSKNTPKLPSDVLYIIYSYSDIDEKVKLKNIFPELGERIQVREGVNDETSVHCRPSSSKSHPFFPSVPSLTWDLGTHLVNVKLFAKLIVQSWKDKRTDKERIYLTHRE
jgi:hypothetical protein